MFVDIYIYYFLVKYAEHKIVHFQAGIYSKGARVFCYNSFSCGCIVNFRHYSLFISAVSVVKQ